MKTNTLFFPVFLISALFLNAAKAQVATVDFASIKQSIDGFGASTAWNGQINDAEADVSFNNANTNQLGLSILRVRIDPNSGSWNDEKLNAQKAKARGAKIVACPWTPPASMKTNSNVVGGELKPESYVAYAAHLKSFCDNAGTIDIISIQNEPNIKVGYESCTWNATQLLNFCKNNASAIGKPVMMPEAFNFNFALSDSTLNDATARSKITYIGGHLYGTTPRNYANAATYAKKVWMTEHYYVSDNIDTCIVMGKEIVDCMYYNMSAYIWWYLRQPGCNIINAGGSIKKKGYILGQFSKFIRPGDYRIEATYQPQIGVNVVAFNGAAMVIVAVNKNTSSVNQTFTFQNGSAASLKKYTTSNSKNLSSDGAIAVSGLSFTTTLDAQSVTTFTGTATTSIAPSAPFFKNSNADIPYTRNRFPAIYALNGQRLSGKTSGMDGQPVSPAIAPGAYILQTPTGALSHEKIMR